MQSGVTGVRSRGDYLGRGINSVFSYAEGLTQTIGATTSTFLGTIISMCNQVSGQVKKLTITEPAFDRGPGFWTQPTDEKIQSIFGSLTDINSQLNKAFEGEGCYGPVEFGQQPVGIL